MEITFTNVFYEATAEAAEQRLHDLRKRDKYPEVKAYIVQEGEGEWRVLRRIRIPPTPPRLQLISTKAMQKQKTKKTRKAGQ